jgi:hypothetical protein
MDGDPIGEDFVDRTLIKAIALAIMAVLGAGIIMGYCKGFNASEQKHEDGSGLHVENKDPVMT